MAFGLYEHHYSWTMGPDFDMSPGDQVRQRWKPQRSAINQLGLTKLQAAKVAAAVRKVTTFDAIHTNVVIKYGSALVRGLLLVAAGAALSSMIRAAKTSEDVWRGALILVLTCAAMVSGLIVMLKLDDEMIEFAGQLNKRRPWLEPVAAAVVWAIRIVAGALGAWYATTLCSGM